MDLEKEEDIEYHVHFNYSKKECEIIKNSGGIKTLKPRKSILKIKKDNSVFFSMKEINLENDQFEKVSEENFVFKWESAIKEGKLKAWELLKVYLIFLSFKKIIKSLILDFFFVRLLIQFV